MRLPAQSPKKQPTRGRTGQGPMNRAVAWASKSSTYSTESSGPANPLMICRWPALRALAFRICLTVHALAAGLGAASVLDVAPVLAQTARTADLTQPESATGFAARATVTGQRLMVVTANAHASRAALEILDLGGSALDAAIAAQMVLGLTEPQSSGIGGGAFLLHFDAARDRVQAWDGRETAPGAADATLLLDPRGQPLDFLTALVGGRAVGTPGVVRMLEAAHARHGRLPWSRLFEPAIRLAREGFEISPRLHQLLTLDAHLARDPQAARLFHDDTGRAHPIGHRLRNPDYADTLAQIAQRGSLALHTGPIARDIVQAVQSHPTNPGRLNEHDLAFYRAIEREALCTPWRDYLVCGMPPPSSGGIAVSQILGMLAALGSPRLADAHHGLMPDGVHALTEAARLAFADRNHYVADPDFTPLPEGLLDSRYLAGRAALIGERSMGRALPGQPRGAPLALADPGSPEQAATTHLSIIDATGNAVSMTSSIEYVFGAHLMVRGFLLNNQLTDFSFAPTHNGQAVANRVEPGKRPRSSMAPTLVFQRNPDGRRGPLLMVVGSPGGSQIIGYVASLLQTTLADGLTPDQALALPHALSRNGPTELELGRTPDALVQALRARGHELSLRPLTSGLHVISRHCDGRGRCTLTGSVDPRREGLALGR